jgi:hypothetical protein
MARVIDEEPSPPGATDGDAVLPTVFVDTSSIVVVLDATFDVLNGINTYSDAADNPPRQSVAISLRASVRTSPAAI